MSDRSANQPAGRGEAETAAPTTAGGGVRNPTMPRFYRRLDLATVLGLGVGLTLVVGALALGGSVGAFFDLPSTLIVLGGTVAITAISFSPPDLRAALGAIGRTMVANALDVRSAANAALSLAEHARRHGALSLQPLLRTTRGWPVMHRAVELIVDGLPADDAERILRTEIDSNMARARMASAVLRRAAEVAPAMGLIGTLVGLVQMLGSLSNPSAIGPAMAVALITTFYGAILGSMVLAPLAAKIDRNADRDALIDGLFLLAAGSVARQENPRRLEMLINTVLPPDLRISNYD